MSGRPTLYTAEIAQRILERLSSGRSLSSVCQDEGMPPLATVLDWVREDRDGFAARYHTTRKVGNPGMHSYATLYTDAVAERLLGELRRGRALHDVCEDDGMPAVRTVARWAANDREGFAVRYLAARAEGRALMARFTLYTPVIADLILDELCNGRSLTDICGDPAMPSIRTVNQWACDDREGFKARYREAREIGCYVLSYQVLDIADDSRDDWTLRRSKDGTAELAVDQGIVKRSRLRVDARQWLLSKLLPKRFGDRPNLDTQPEGGSDIAELLKLIDGRTRGLPSEDQPLPFEAGIE